MRYWFWKIVLSVKYWRVLLNRPKKVNSETGSDSSRSSTFVAVLILLVPILVGAGFGYLSWEHSNRLKAQRAVDANGVAVIATIEGLKIEEFRNDTTRMGDGANRAEPSLFCVVQVRYSVPGSSQTLRKVVWLEDDSICSRYKTTDPIAGKALPDDPKVFVLDEGRLAEYWYWICLLLFGLFTIVPVVLLLRVLTYDGNGRRRE